GTSVHVAAGFIGLTAIFWQVSWLFEIVKILGAAYLVYMGYKVFATKTHPVEFTYQKGADHFSRAKAIRIGFYTCVSNPKSALFYLSLFTAVIPPSSPGWAQVFMAIMMIVLSVSWYSGVAFLFSEPLVQRGYRKVERGVNYVVGGLFIGLGLRLTMMRK
ncbi:MAG: LysE family transporter, partial [Anaerolineae bacterium]|nr:LysE family transporter [Anaerolineae bacterium]